MFASLGLGATACAEGRLDEADRLFGRAREIAGSAGFTQLVGHALVGLATVAVGRGQHAEAAALLGRADDLFDEVAGPSGEFDPALAASTEASARAVLGAQAYAAAYAAGRLSRN